MLILRCLLDSCYSRHGYAPAALSLSESQCRNADFQDPPQNYKIRTCILKDPQIFLEIYLHIDVREILY